MARENLKDSIQTGTISLELLNVAVFDLLHAGFALEEIGEEIGGGTAGTTNNSLWIENLTLPDRG
jgi:hypothetical protein